MHLASRVAAALTALVTVVGACSSDPPEDPEAFCAAFREATTVAVGAGLELDDPASVANALADLEILAELAPDDLAADAATVSAVYDEVLTAIAATAPGARSDVLRELQGRLDEASEPAARLQTYGTETCGITFDAPAEPTPTPTPLDIDD